MYSRYTIKGTITSQMWEVIVPFIVYREYMWEVIVPFIVYREYIWEVIVPFIVYREQSPLTCTHGTQ
jgi:hypothetical protein